MVKRLPQNKIARRIKANWPQIFSMPEMQISSDKLPKYLEVFYEFWTGIIIGVIVDAIIGIIVASVLAVSRRRNYAEIFRPAQYPMAEEAINDATA